MEALTPRITFTGLTEILTMREPTTLHKVLVTVSFDIASTFILVPILVNRPFPQKVHFVYSNDSYLLKSDLSQLYGINYIVWIQDGVPQNDLMCVRQILPHKFGDELNFRHCVANFYGWRHSLDLTIIDFWLCCYLKSKVYASKAKDLWHLNQVIKRVTQNLF